MRVLLVNDDGYGSKGIEALRLALQAEHEVWTVAPAHQVSAIGHAITLRRPIRAVQTADRAYRVEGYPTDCVNLALWHIMPERPNLVIAGINHGWNLAEDVTYSGTVAAAMEGAVHKIFSIAFSVSSRMMDTSETYLVMARWLTKNLNRFLRLPLSRGGFLNINWPERFQPRGIRVTRLGERLHPNSIIERVDPSGVPYFWLTRGHPRWQNGEDLDVHAVRDGFISLTPMTIDWTDHAARQRFKTQVEGRTDMDPVDL